MGNVALVLRAGLILGLCPVNERRRYKATPSLIGWAQTYRISPEEYDFQTHFMDRYLVTK